MKKLLALVICSCSIVICKAQSDSLLWNIKKGEEALSNSLTLPAYQYFKQAVAISNDNVDAVRGLAKSAQQLNYLAIARETYKKVLLLSPKDTGAVIQLTKLYFATRQYQDAVDMGKKAISMGVGSNNEWVIAKSYYELEQFASSLEFLDKSWRKDSSNAEVPFTAARCLIEMNNYKKAAECYEQALTLNPTNAAWMYEAGLTYSAIPDNEKAIPWFEKAAANGYKRSDDYLENLSNSYISVKSYDKGLSIIRELLERKPQDLEILFLSGESYFRSAKYQEAIDTYDQMLKIDKGQARALYMIGIVYIKKGENNKGESICDQAIRMDPSLSSLKQKRSQFGL
jgi:tetratricopeptide (TPR) repeat protein